MNRVLLFIDDDTFSKNPTGDYPFNYVGLGLGNDVIRVSNIADIDEKGEYVMKVDANTLRNSHLLLGDGDRCLIVGKKAWDIFSSVYHNGLRSENGFDASRLDRLGINTGAYVKVLWRDKDYGMDKLDVDYFLSPDFVKKWNYNGFRQVIVSKYLDAIKFLNFLDSLDEEFGFDYETNGMADIPIFEISGCSICTSKYGAFFSFTDLRRYSTNEEYKDFCSKFAQFIVKNQGKIWAYNLQFEQQVTFRYFNVLVELCDSAVYNIVEGFHSKRYSLKWTSQRVLNSRYKANSGIKSWDDDFDYLNEALNRMYWSTAPDPDDPKKKTVRVPKCDETNFMHTDEFKEICIRYPGYEDEFIYLISTYFGNTFMNIPSEILGYYCNLDSYMTIMIRNQLKDDYTDTCLSIYLDNVRLGARLHSSGMYKDEDYHARYQFQCDTLQSYGMTYAATCYTKLKLDYLRSRIPDVNKFNSSFRVLLSRDEMRNGDVVKIAKTIISNNLSDLYESGLDEPMIYEIYGEGIYNALIEGLKDAGCKAELSLMRKKKPFAFIADKLAKELGLDQLDIDSIKIDKNHSKDLARYFNIENIIDLLSQYFLCEEGYKGFLDIWKNQMTDIYHIPLKFKFMGETLSSKEYVDRVKKKFFPCTSPKEYGPMLEFLVDKYKVESSFLSMIYNNLNKIEIKKIFDSMYGKDGDRKPLNYCFDHFINNIVSYPDELKEIIQMYLNDPYGERMTDTFDDARGLKRA